MSEMIERVAMAIAQCDDLHDCARAAIAAMREPTAAMCEAADVVECNQPECIWQAMIDAALGKEKEKEE
jgi:hypothetical protein